MTTKRNRIAVVYDESDLGRLVLRRALLGIKQGLLTKIVSAIQEISINHSEYLLVLTDWKMPDTKGLELANGLHK
jgi:hypothetical protein